MEGIGNDFVVVPAEFLDGIDASRLALSVCERRFGIGADGLLTIGPAARAGAAFSFRMYNPDGTPDMCGNGLRCAALYAHQAGLLEPHGRQFAIDTVDGLLRAEVLSLGQTARTAQVRVEMEVPRFSPIDIPVTGTAARRVVDHLLRVADATLSVTSVNTGSTHTVIFSDQLPSEEQFQMLSPLIEHDPFFPTRTSVLWATRHSSGHFTTRIWERGVGETLGCGTGACAIAAAAIIKGMAHFGKEITVQSKGGALEVVWPAVTAPVELTGPARWIFEGETTL
jgi:diaminopimelate epimerase